MQANDIDWRDLSQTVYRFFAATFGHNVASDLTQETLKRVFEKVQQGLLIPQRGTVRSFAFGVAVNVRREHRKYDRRQLLRVVNGDDVEAVIDGRLDPESALANSRQVDQLKAAINQLSSAEQEVISLMVDSELTVNEAATILGMPPGTVKSHMSRAKHRLRQLMQ